MTVVNSPPTSRASRWKRLSRFLKADLGSKTGAQEISESTFVIGTVVVTFGIVGLIAVWVCATGLTYKSGNHGFNAFSISACDTLVAGAAAAVGGLLGFLFGIPRTLDPASRAVVATAASQGDPAISSQAALSANTNLERISDWFTTLLIGATLVQFRDVLHWVARLGDRISKDNLYNGDVIPFIVVYFGALSFIGVYLITRLYLTYALQQTLFLLTGNYSDYPLQKLKADVADALATGDAADLARVNAEFRAWRFQGSDLDDPGLNYSLARMLAQILADNAAGDKKDETVAKLKDVVERASRSAKIKKQLSDDLTNGRLTTGITDVDTDLKAKTAGAP